MDKEHEEAMRADFAEYIAIKRQQQRPSVTTTEAEELGQQRSTLAGRWKSGPHAEQWDYLNEVHRQYEASPHDMLRHRDMTRAPHPADLDSVEGRSLEQATQIAMDRDPGLARISKGYIEINGVVVFDGTKQPTQEQAASTDQPRPRIERGR